MTVQKSDDVRTVTLRIKDGGELKKIELPPYRWASFRQRVTEINDGVKSVANGVDGINLRLHFGGTYYVSVASGIRCVDFRKFYKPYGATEAEIKPTKLSVALHEWAHLYNLIDTVNARYPTLGSAQPCYYQDDHINQMGWIDCTKCHPFGHDASVSTP